MFCISVPIPTFFSSCEASEAVSCTADVLSARVLTACIAMLEVQYQHQLLPWTWTGQNWLIEDFLTLIQCKVLSSRAETVGSSISCFLKPLPYPPDTCCTHSTDFTYFHNRLRGVIFKGNHFSTLTVSALISMTLMTSVTIEKLSLRNICHLAEEFERLLLTIRAPATLIITAI